MFYESCSQDARSGISNDVHTTYVPYRYREYKCKFHIARKTRYNTLIYTSVYYYYIYVWTKRQQNFERVWSTINVLSMKLHGRSRAIPTISAITQRTHSAGDSHDVSNNVIDCYSAIRFLITRKLITSRLFRLVVINFYFFFFLIRLENCNYKFLKNIVSDRKKHWYTLRLVNPKTVTPRANWIV